MTIKIVHLDGTEMLLTEQMRIVDFYVEPLTPIYAVENVSYGKPVVNHTGYNARKAVLEIAFTGYTMDTYAKRYAELRALFTHTKPFYVVDLRDNGKRWLVQNLGGFAPQRKNKRGQMTINFICLSKYGESIGTTLDDKTWSAEAWAWGSGLTWSGDFTYTHTSNTFSIFNYGTAEVDPRESDLKITIQAIASEYLEIRNITTGDTYRFNGALAAEDTLVLDGIKTLKNGVNAFLSTNKKVLTLAVGENEFEVVGGTLLSIAFDFRFLYL